MLATKRNCINNAMTKAIKRRSENTARDEPHTALWAKAALTFGTVLFGLLLTELALRMLGWAQAMEFRSNPNWGYLMRPSQQVSSYGHAIQINSLGLRGPDVTPIKPSRTIRILFVGDSVTYGGGRIREEELFCRVVERLARSDGLPVEVINLSAPGWSPQNWGGYVRRRGILGADAVVLTLPECDLFRPFSTLDMHGLVEHAPPRVLSVLLKALDATRTDHPYAGADREADAQRNLEAVRYLIDVCRSRLFLTVFVPYLRPVVGPAAWEPFEVLVQTPLDLRSDLTDRALFFDGIHLSVSGHRLVAHRVYERLRTALVKLEETAPPSGT